MFIHECPRCGERKLEYMRTHAFCWECGYSSVIEVRDAELSALKRFFAWIDRQMTEGRMIAERVEKQKAEVRNRYDLSVPML
jgi:ribosomal protein L37E